MSRLSPDQKIISFAATLKEIDLLEELAKSVTENENRSSAIRYLLKRFAKAVIEEARREKEEKDKLLFKTLGIV